MTNKTIIVIGATCSLGKEICFIYAKNGFDLILISRREDKNEDLKNQIKQLYPKVEIYTYQLDILDLNKQVQIYKEINKIPDGVISLIGETHYVNEIRDKNLLKIINTNYSYLVTFLSYFLNDFQKNKKGFLICISSVAGLRGRAKNFIYGSAKSGLNTFLSGCRNYFNNTEIFIMTVLPGFIKNNNNKKNIIENLLEIEPSILAKKIYLAHKQKKEILYSSYLWKLIMIIIRIMPNKIFNKLKF